MGDTVVFEDEVNPAMSAALDAGLSVTALHNHFFFEEEGRLVDIPEDTIRVGGLPQVPEGMMVTHIDVVVRLTPK